MDELAESLLQSLGNPKALPVEALKAATLDRARVVPVLIQELRKFAADPMGYGLTNCLPAIAIYLLAEWQVTGAFETVLDCFAQECQGRELLDLIVEDGPVILAALSEAKLDALESLAERRDINEWARGAALKAMVALVLWDKVPRDNVVTPVRFDIAPKVIREKLRFGLGATSRCCVRAAPGRLDG